MIKIFISHSSEDSTIAESLADLFHTALHLSKSEIRCTSVDGYRLPAGANTDEQLRREVLDAPVLVGLISQHSFESAYVLFELGARWGKNAFLAPVLAPGVSASILHQLVSDIASQLGIPTEPAATYHSLIEAMIQLAPAEDDPAPKTGPQARIRKGDPGVLESEDEYANAEEIIQQHCEAQWNDDYSMRRSEE